MKITVIILTHHRLGLIKACLDSIERQQSNPFSLEIVALLNGVDDESHDFLKNYELTHKNFSFTALVKSVPVGEARNILIEKSSGDWICFIDDDVELPNNYFSIAHKIISSHVSLDVFGGPDQMKTTSSVFQEILSAVMGSFFAMGPTAKRHSRKFQSQEGTEVNLILCNLWIKNEIFKQGYLFPKGFIRNEENILIANLERNNKVLHYDPKLYVFHERKSSLKKLIKVTYLSGQYRTYGFFKESGTFNIIFMVPQLFLVLFLIAGFCGVKFLALYLVMYLLTIMGISINLVKNQFSISKMLTAVLIFISYHFSYAFGQFSGYLKKIREVL